MPRPPKVPIVRALTARQHPGIWAPVRDTHEKNGPLGAGHDAGIARERRCHHGTEEDLH